MRLEIGQRLHAGVLRDDHAAAARACRRCRGRATGSCGRKRSDGHARRASPSRLRCSAAPRRSPDGTRALEPLDLTIDAGETVVFLGPSGCGKTTTLRIIAGLESPDAGGRVLFDDDRRDAARRSSSATSAWCSSRYALFPNMSVADNIAYGLKIRKRAAAGDRRPRRRDAGHDAHRGAWPIAASTSSRAGSASAWRSRARSRCSPAPCCSTSR